MKNDDKPWWMPWWLYWAIKQSRCEHLNVQHDWTGFAECTSYCPDCFWSSW